MRTLAFPLLLTLSILAGCDDNAVHLDRMDAESILAKGGSLKVSAATFDRMDLQSMAAKASEGGSKLTVTHSNNLDRMDMQSIVEKNPGIVTFE